MRIVRHFHERPTRRLAIASIAALVFAFAYLIQPAWDNERAHYDLTRALAQGSPSIRLDAGASDAFGVAPAVEYSWKPTLGVLLGARVIAAGRNTAASITPAVAVNFVR